MDKRPKIVQFGKPLEKCYIWIIFRFGSLNFQSNETFWTAHQLKLYMVLYVILLKGLYMHNNNVKNTRCHTRNIFTIPRSLTTKSGKRFSVYLPQMVNKI